MPNLFGILVASALAAAAVAVGCSQLAAQLDVLNGWALKLLKPQMEAVGMDASKLPAYLRTWRVATAAVLLVFWLGFGMLPVALVLTLLTHQLGLLYINFRIERHARLIQEQVAGSAREVWAIRSASA